MYDMEKEDETMWENDQIYYTNDEIQSIHNLNIHGFRLLEVSVFH